MAPFLQLAHLINPLREADTHDRAATSPKESLYSAQDLRPWGGPGVDHVEASYPIVIVWAPTPSPEYADPR